MRHRKKGRKLNRTWSHRKALMRNMVTTFLDQEQIETTDAKAKELRPLAEKLVTLAKRGGEDLSARRRALRIVRDRKVVAKLFDEIGPRYADRPGGYTRIVKVENRRGDGAPLSMLRFVTEPVTFKEKKHRPEEEMDRVGAEAEKAPVEAEEKPSAESEEAAAEAEPDDEAAEAEAEDKAAGTESEGESAEAEAADESPEPEGEGNKAQEASDETEPATGEEKPPEEAEEPPADATDEEKPKEG